MSLLLLDTTFLIDAERQRDGLDELVDDEDDVAIAAITVAELLVGAKLASGKRRATREAYVADIVSSVPVVSYDTVVAFSHAELLTAVRKGGQPRGAHDLIIAATARATNRIVVTADAAGFRDLPGVTVRSSP